MLQAFLSHETRSFSALFLVETTTNHEPTAMEKLVDLWAQVEWSKLPVMVANYPSNAAEMNPLLEASMESLQMDLLEICGKNVGLGLEDVSEKLMVEAFVRPVEQPDLCVMGIFSLQLLTFSGLVREKSVERRKVPMMLEKNVGSFMHVLKRYVSPHPSNLYADFGSHRRTEDLDISDVAIQFLGRTLYQLADLPPPPGSENLEQFAFGRNWRQFVEKISVEGLISSVKELRGLVGPSNLHGLTVLDLGCGSGLSSLSFKILGANVISVDVQDESLEASRHLQMRFKSVLNNVSSEDSTWQFEKASVLDAWALAARKPVDVYTWGVLHHTGDVWQAIHNAQLPLREDGLLLVAVYAEEFYDEKDNILMMKDFYRKANRRQQEHLDIAVGIYWLRPLLRAGKNPFEVLRNFSQMRGMDFWTDVRDWLGGWPTEFVSTSAMLSFVKHTGLRCVHVRRNGGNTEFALTKPGPGVQRWTAGRICEDLEFQEDFTQTLPLLQQSLYHWPETMQETMERRWWISRLPDWMRNYSDGNDNPQKDRLLLIRKSGEPFGYPSAQFARPDSIRDLRLSLYAFWEGFAYISPGTPDDWMGDSIPKGVPFRVKGDTADTDTQLRACLLPLAEVSLQQEAEIRVLATEAGLT